MKLSQRFALGLLCALGSACTEFPAIPASGCGNHVIEGKEDCDGFPDPQKPNSVCLPPGATFECHYDCSVGRNGKQAECPEGWGCDADFVCRAPTGLFTESSRSPDVGAWSLTTGDFDGDGRDDVVSAEPLDLGGATRLRFNYFDAEGELSETRLFPKTVLSPTINRGSSDHARSDVAFTVGPIGVMKGRADRNWVPEVFSSYRRANARVRIVGVHDTVVDQSSTFTTLISGVNAETGFYLGDQNGILRPRVFVPGSVDELVGDPVSGDVFADPKHSPCLEPVFAMRGATRFGVVDTCDTDETGKVIWRKEFVLTEIQLVPPAPIDAAPQLVDMNHDDHLDVLLGAGGIPYVAYGDGQALAGAIPYTYPERSFPSGTPLAVGDVNQDGVLDFVFPDRLMASAVAYTGAVPTYAEIRNRHTSPWTAAIIGDFNGNGLMDVVTASSGSLNIDFFNGVGSGYFTGSDISTSAPVQFLAAGDFDVDRITDLAFSEVARDGEVNRNLKVAFGNAFALPGSPVEVGQVAGLEALNSFRDSGRDNLTACSSETVDGVQTGALTLFAAGPDRVPFAPLALTEFASNSSVETADAFSVVSGHFVSPAQTGLLALAIFHPRGKQTPPTDIWSLPDIIEPGGSSSVRLKGSLDSRFQPIAFNVEDNSISADVAATVADLDDDGLDEGIFAMPADGGSHCGLLLIGIGAPGPRGEAAQTPLIIEERCEDPQILAVKFADSNVPHLALLTGKSGADGRHLYVLWNDGQGQFSSENKVQVSPDSDSPQAFTVLSLDKTNTALVYITKDALRMVRAPLGREFPAPDEVPGGVRVSNGTGIVAADVNGDRLSDLVFSESGQLRVLKAGLEVK